MFLQVSHKFIYILYNYIHIQHLNIFISKLKFTLKISPENNKHLLFLMSVFLYFLSGYSFSINVIRSISKILWSKIFTDYFRYMLAYINLLIIFLLTDIYLLFLDKVTWSSVSPKLIDIFNPVSVWSLVLPKQMG